MASTGDQHIDLVVRAGVVIVDLGQDELVHLLDQPFRQGLMLADTVLIIIK